MRQRLPEETPEQREIRTRKEAREIGKIHEEYLAILDNPSEQKDDNNSPEGLSQETPNIVDSPKDNPVKDKKPKEPKKVKRSKPKLRRK